MTAEEAIREIKKIKPIIKNLFAYVDEISEEVLSLEMAIEALEKQIAKKPKIWDEGNPYETPWSDNWGYECPCCGNRDIDIPEHHCECGQAIDWSEEE